MNPIQVPRSAVRLVAAGPGVGVSLSPSLSVCLSLSIAALLTLESRHSSLFSASLHLSPSISLVSASSSLSVDLSRLSLSLSAFLSSSDPSCSHSLDDAQTLSSSRRPSYALSQGHHSQGHHLSLSFDQTHIELSLLLHRRRLSSSLVSSTDDAVQYIHGLAAKGVHYIHRPAPTLQDLGFFLLPELGQERSYISETLFTTVFLSFFLVSLVTCFVSLLPSYLTKVSNLEKVTVKDIAPLLRWVSSSPKLLSLKLSQAHSVSVLVNETGSCKSKDGV
ncbi:Uncharacterized protein Rs2_35093 [Raphanus sativus]|nr:Uncharacterized protein Rs2_35093 [Raphanus sativus]